jgi:regulator of protease activity HflC (stomatin/prohibitin superfamily)
MFWISVVRQYERAVIFRLGRYVGTREPGLVILIPLLDRGVRVDMREQVLDEPPQPSITRDNAIVAIDYVVYMRVTDPEAAIINVTDFTWAVRNLATTTLRAVIGDITVEEVLSQRDRINRALQQKLAAETDRWGLAVQAIEIREITPAPDIQQAMTRLLTADRTKRALITESEGDRQAAINRAEGAKRGAILDAEGERESQILRAEGSRQAAILNAEGYATGLDRVYTVARGVDGNTMGLQYLDMLKGLGEGASTKWIIPSGLAGLATTLGRGGAGAAVGDAAASASAETGPVAG